jgi:hypothetical protein
VRLAPCSRASMTQLGQEDGTVMWYCSYGSNLSRARFMAYVTGGTPSPPPQCLFRPSFTPVRQARRLAPRSCTRDAATALRLLRTGRSCFPTPSLSPSGLHGGEVTPYNPFCLLLCTPLMCGPRLGGAAAIDISRPAAATVGGISPATQLPTHTPARGRKYVWHLQLLEGSLH